MTDAEILKMIEAAIREETENPSVVVTPTTTAMDVPGWDSLAHGRIMLAIEIASSAHLDIDKTYAATCVGDLIPLIRAGMAPN